MAELKRRDFPVGIPEHLWTLPEDVSTLFDYLMVVRQLIGEKVRETEGDWDREHQSRPEIDALLLLEEEICKKVANVRSDSLSGILRKFAIWDLLVESDADSDETAPRDRVILSIRRDLEAILRH